jgi:hypothetical protein
MSKYQFRRGRVGRENRCRRGSGKGSGRPAEFLHAYWDEIVVATGAKRVILVH